MNQRLDRLTNHTEAIRVPFWSLILVMFLECGGRRQTGRGKRRNTMRRATTTLLTILTGTLFAGAALAGPAEVRDG